MKEKNKIQTFENISQLVFKKLGVDYLTGYKRNWQFNKDLKILICTTCD